MRPRSSSSDSDSDSERRRIYIYFLESGEKKHTGFIGGWGARRRPLQKAKGEDSWMLMIGSTGTCVYVLFGQHIVQLVRSH